MFSLLGPAFQYKSLISPAVKIHLFRTYACSILRSGLSSLALRKPQLEPIQVFHRKCLKSFLHLSKTTPTSAIHFLFGELPMEGKIHRDMFSLFYSIWSNPGTKIFKITKYLLENSTNNSHTWAINLRHISKIYELEDPLECLKKSPPSKSHYKELILTKITSYHERELRKDASTKELMPYLNVSLIGLRGKLHPAILGVNNTHSVKKMRLHIKMLSGNYLTFDKKSQQSGGSPFCPLCKIETEPETIEHLLAKCEELTDIRTRILNSMNNIIQTAGLNLSSMHVVLT